MNAKRAMLRDITPGQIKKIHALVTALGIDDGLYREILWTRFKVKSSKELAGFQVGSMIEELEEKAIQGGVWEKSPFKQQYEALNGRPGFATVAQLALVENLWSAVSRMETPELRAKSLRSFIFKIAKVSDLRFLDTSGAGKVITALRQMVKRQDRSELKEELL